VRFLEFGPITVERAAVAVFVIDTCPTTVVYVHSHGFQYALDVEVVVSGPYGVTGSDGHTVWCWRCVRYMRNEVNRLSIWIERVCLICSAGKHINELVGTGGVGPLCLNIV